MGAVWLASLPDVLRAAGLQVETWPGWETRSRSSGGYDAVWGIGIHHDAIRTGVSLETRCRIAWDSTANPNRPIGAIWLHTDGRVMVGAAGATNTQGNGGPQQTSKGVIPLNQGNRFMLSIEASNNGIGEPWPKVQQDAYVVMCAALTEWLDLDPGDVFGHFEWTSRKIDPAGPSRFAPAGGTWNMDDFRGEVWLEGQVPTPPPTNPNGEVDMMILDLNPGTDWWVAMVLDANSLSHLVDGYHVEVLMRGNVPRVQVDERDMEGVLRSVTTLNGSPFGSGRSSHNEMLNGLWNRARGSWAKEPR